MVRKRLAVVFAFLLICAVPLWRVLFTGQAIGEFDAIRHMAPWNGPAPQQPWDVLEADSVLQFYPWRHMVFDAWGKHQLPLWNPYELAGTPLLANSQSAGFYPPHIVLGLLHVPTAPAMALLAWFHLALAGLGVYALARRLGAGRLGAFVGGSSFSLSVFMLDWTALPSVPSTVAWIPWLLVGVVSIFDFRFSILKVAGTAFCAAMMIFAGHLQFAAYGFMAAALFTVGLALVSLKKQPRSTGFACVCCLMSMVLGGAMASPQLLPVLQFSRLSPRQNQATAAGYSEYVKKSIQPFEFANLAVPNALGSPREDSAVKAGLQTLSAYWPMHAKGGANLAESAVTIGPLVLGLLVIVPWKRKVTWILAAISGIALLLALGTPLNAVFYFGVPGWSATGSPCRIIVLFVMGACVLASLAVDRAHRVSGKLRIGLVVLPFFIGGLCVAILPGMAPDAGRAQEAVDALRAAATGEAFISLLGACVLAGVGLALLLLPQAARYRRGVALFPLALAWLGYASNMVPTGEPLPITASQDMQRVAFVNAHWGIPLAPDAIYPPNTASLFGIHELGGYDSLLDRNTVLMLEKVDQTVPDRPETGPAPPENGNMMFIKPSLDKAQLREAGVTKIYWPSPTGEPRIEDLPGPGRVRGGLPVGGGFGDEMMGSKGSVVDDAYDHQALQVTPGMVSWTELDRNLPGWIDQRTGQELKGSPWREIEVTPDQTKIELRYDPPGLRTGLIIGAFGWIAAALCLALGVRVKPRLLPTEPEAAKISSNPDEG